MGKRSWIIVSLLLLTSLIYADVKVKDIDGTNVEIIFTYSDDSADEVNVIGSFNNWTEPGDAMEKNSSGVWEYRLEAHIDDEIIYKFFIDSSYITDENAPDEKDDGFGGMNGLIIVADNLSAGPVTAAESGSKEPKEKEYKSKFNFGMYTIMGSMSEFSTQGVVNKSEKGLETDYTGIYAKSYLKMGGTIVPDVKAWFEIKGFDATQTLWAQDSRGIVSPELEDGVSSAITGMLVNPINYLGSGNNPELNSTKLGIESKYVEWETGYGYAKPQGRNVILWETLNARDANDGYMRFDLGKELKKVGKFNIEANFTPNIMTGNYGLFSWMNLSSGKTTFDFQYDMKSAATDDLSGIFDKLYHQDFIVGAKTNVKGIDIKAQSLINYFSETDFDAEDHIAGQVQLSKKGIILGYNYTGSGVEMLFGNNDSHINIKGSHIGYVNYSYNKIRGMKLGTDFSYTYIEDTGNDDQHDRVYVKPYLDYDLSKLLNKNAWLNSYVKLGYITQDGWVFTASKEKFLLSEFGVKLAMDKMDIIYGFDNHHEDQILNTLITTMSFDNNLKTELGLGIRTLKHDPTDKEINENNMFGFSLGGSWIIPSRKLKSPLLYGAFVYNIDPYDDNTNNLKLSDFVLSDGADTGNGKAKLRLMLKWDF